MTELYMMSVLFNVIFIFAKITLYMTEDEKTRLMEERGHLLIVTTLLFILSIGSVFTLYLMVKKINK